MMTITAHIYVFHSCFCLHSSPPSGQFLACINHHSSTRYQSYSHQPFNILSVKLHHNSIITILNTISDSLLLKKMRARDCPSSSVSSYLWWSMTLRRLRVSGSLFPLPHYWQPFMLCDYDFPPAQVWAGGHSPRPPSWHSYTGYYHFIWHNNLISITPAVFRK